jgi:hypothetical protein
MGWHIICVFMERWKNSEKPRPQEIDVAKYKSGIWDEEHQGQAIWMGPGNYKYIGGMKDNKFHGQGTFTCPKQPT